MCEKEFLMWLAARLVNVYGESELTDFVVKTRAIAANRNNLEEGLREARQALELIAAGERSDGTYNRDRKAVEVLAKQTLESIEKRGGVKSSIK